MSNSPRVRQLPPRPKITLPVPGQYPQYPQTSLGYVTTPYGQTPIPLTPVSGQPHMMYANKASGFMFAQLKGLRNFTKSGLSVGEKCAFWLYEKVSSWSKKWFTHIFLFFIVLLYSIAGAMIFIAVEGNYENELRLDIIKHRNKALNEIKELSNNPMITENPELWKGRAASALSQYEIELYKKFKHGITDPNDKTWTFWNAVFYCGTIYTTIGYGHISPNTTTGKALTIVYAIFGIPIFLIILADFGKLFTRGIKFLWAFVRRVYYTGSCRKVRRTAPMQEVMKGVQLVYDFATFRRPSQMNPEELEEMQRQQNQAQTVINLDGNMPQPDTPGTPAMSAYAIDDEFNLPISVAISVLLGYIFIGASGYYMWEDWSFFESFYFVFISMSTIGFGDYVPQHPMYMMGSIVYLLFGLALTSMCINVVQVMLSDSFKQASQKIGATIGFEVVEDDGSVQPAVPDPVELADVHVTVKESNSQEKVAPKAQQENVEL
ncbi:TWiK family of potassium channels protein 18 isoform X3 [Cephus cinctus]|uniref:TWiK family of potassium channels protein 18 isoform X3 n=1 Tax=Cephus cinctus TaxID=211228 RepID=A0AAJ7FJ22_CEPCN|nr:TWiK family of potassium channels protein 18 isoform X3 [Cephus cinctus]